MNVLLDSSLSSFDFGATEDWNCDPHSFAYHHQQHHSSFRLQRDDDVEELLVEPTSLAIMMQHQQQQQLGKRTRRASATKKEDSSSSTQAEDLSAAAAPGKRRASKKASSVAASSSCATSSMESLESAEASGGYTKRDILSGRGGLANKHFGNKVFRRLIKHNKDLYRRLKSKVKQELLIKSILLAVESQGGRFLREDKRTGKWYPIDEKEAWSKTCQALREPERSKASDGEEDASEEGTLDGSLTGSVSSSSCYKKKKAAAVAAPKRPPPPSHGAQSHPFEAAASVTALSPLARMARPYTTENPPSVDRRIFDHASAAAAAAADQPLPYNDNDEEDAADDDMAVAPPRLEMGLSGCSWSGFSPSIPGYSGMDHRARQSFTYQQNESVNAEPTHGFQGYGASFYQDYYHASDTQQFLHGSQSSLMQPPPPQLLRSDSMGNPLGHSLGLGLGLGQQHPEHALMMMSTAAAARSSSSSSLGVPPPPPLPLLRSASSAAFYRSLEEVPSLDRQESTSSIDFLAFVNGTSGNSAPV